MTDVVAALIWKDDKFLICQRPAHKKRGLLWEFAGGKTEPGETREEALKRELMEELKLEVEIGDVFMELVHEYPDITVNLILYNCTALNKPEKIEHNDLKWIHPSEIESFDFCPADTDILAKIKEIYL
ncbi:MAG: (deoxy)nucleoside triphosphate pyrophosphohydrolase [Anaerofustis stercorihominis]|nr:(deoxy)nucleoside triphosphate pyrophosphohydrolase [Anaerofustis stercorihominis]